MKYKQLAMFLLLAVIGWIIVDGWLGERGLKNIRLIMGEYYQIIANIKETQKNNEVLTAEIVKLEKDKFWLEKQIREKLGWVRPGEIIYKFEDTKNDGTLE